MKIGESIKITTLSYWPDKEFEILGCFRALYDESIREYRCDIWVDASINTSSKVWPHNNDTTKSLSFKPKIINEKGKDANQFLSNVDAIIDLKFTNAGYTGTFIKFKK